MIKTTIFTILLLSFCKLTLAQDQKKIEDKFEELSFMNEGLNEKVRIDISGLTLYDFIASIADEHRLNISVDNKLNQLINNNFYDLQVKDVFLFLIEKYNLEVKFINGIIVFNKKDKVIEVKKPSPVIDVNYNDSNDFLSLKLRKDSLSLVAERITEVSDKNIVLSPNIKNLEVSAYILNRPFDQVLEMMAKSNNLKVSKDENNFYYLEKRDIINEKTSTQNLNGNYQNNINEQTGLLDVTLTEKGYLNIKAYEANLSNIIMQAASLLNMSYFMYDEPKKEQTTFSANQISFDDLLIHLFKGKNFTYKNINGLYVIGEHNTEGLRETELIQLQNRTLESVLSTLPQKLLEGVEIKEVIELNGLIASGSLPKIIELKNYIREIDQVVPLIQIEVLIVQYEKSHDVQTGLRAILGEQGQTIATEGNIFPTTDVTLNSSSINNLINSFNGFGIFNLGKVTQNFYANLSAMENNSIINLQSTPKIATLNGHEATVSIGQTSYYFEQTNRLINTGITDNILQSGQWKPTEANLSVMIKPNVSKDEQVTLNIRVEKSAFTGRSGENAPPDRATQQFQSLVRVRNNEMILLGGLDELEKQDTGTGTPFLARIPIIKWFFSSRGKSKSKSKLHVFIRPTIIY
ncbi:type II secretion system protein D (GspD) [Mesonia phycicola]|uniref:Type II secretion system protein D (GspD) n=1 Tax=Mesonia phycicola TaxID=579105 RepID=A0A1M6DL45_9FLAO|nr:type II and III secretion system protein [Mesonia phycicola]SHI73749.1 type II secretion system protein D (GspD) [Mesonia phycicola]